MKSLKVLAVAIVLLTIGGMSASAQKIGYINFEAMVGSLPEIQKVQENLQKFQVDSIGGEYERIYNEYKRKDSIVKDVKTPKTVKETAEKDRNDLEATLQDWQNIANRLSQAKQSELLSPLYKKVQEAINAVAKEKGYTYVITQEAFFVAPDADNLAQAVAQKLGIKLPALNAAPQK